MTTATIDKPETTWVTKPPNEIRKNPLRVIKKQTTRTHTSLWMLVNELENLQRHRSEMHLWEECPELQSFVIKGVERYDDSEYYWDLQNLESLEFVSEEAKRSVLTDCDFVDNREDWRDDEPVDVTPWLDDLACTYDFAYELGLDEYDLDDDGLIKFERPKNLKGAIAQIEQAAVQAIFNFLNTRLSGMDIYQISIRELGYDDEYFSSGKRESLVGLAANRADAKKIAEAAISRRVENIANGFDWVHWDSEADPTFDYHKLPIDERIAFFKANGPSYLPTVKRFINTEKGYFALYEPSN